ncbi:MAG: TIGR00366 family protein [Flavobacteriales bacterium]
MLNAYVNIVRRVLPSPFSIALILTLVSFACVIALQFSSSGQVSLEQSLTWWVGGLWNPSLMVFAMQMMLMLVLGHALALTNAAKGLIDLMVLRCNSSESAAMIVSLVALTIGLFNWGLGLIFGAILARKVGEQFSQTGRPLNYGLIGAAGYAALMIWHGGISGSALIKVAESGNLVDMMSGVLTSDEMAKIPMRIGLSETAFSSSNVIITIAVLTLVPASLYWIGKTFQANELVNIETDKKQQKTNDEPVGAEYVDHSRVTGTLVGSALVGYCLYLALLKESSFLNFFNPNNINLLLLALALMLHQRISDFLKAVESAISGASGILIQFPLYFGIIGLISGSGLIEMLSNFFISISNTTTYPLFTYLSAGMVNIFVPSGGGQWVIQGPIVIKAALSLGVPLEKSIMALAYGDQITNMLQPFWALPLLGITKLSARDILPYTLVMFAVGFVIYGMGLLVLY